MTRRVHYILGTLFLVFYEVSLLYYADYILWNAGRRDIWMNTRRGKVYAALIAGVTLIVILNGRIFFIDQNNVFHFAKEAYIANIFPLYILVMSTLVFVKNRWHEFHERDKAITFGSVILIFGVCSDNVIEDTILGDFFLAFCMMVLCMRAENPEYLKSERIRCFNVTAFTSFVDECLERKVPFCVYGLEIRNMDTVSRRRGIETTYSALSSCTEWIERFFPESYVFYTNNFCLNIVTFQPIHKKMYQDFSQQIRNRIFRGNKQDVAFWMRDIFVDTRTEMCKNAEYIINGENHAIETSSHRSDAVSVNESVYACVDNQSRIYELLECAETKDRLRVYVQPIFSTKTGKITGGEVLARIFDDAGNIIKPAEFIPVAEKSGIIIRLSYLQFEKVCQYLSENGITKNDLSFLNINCSPVQFQDLFLADKLKKIADRYKVDFSFFKFEVTESYMACSDIMKVHIDKFKKYGASIAMDDFGKGNSNLSRLKEIDFDVAKIDMSLVWAYFDSQDMMLEDIVDMLKKGNLKIVAEGVETREMAESLWDMGCDYLQGYYFSKPLPAENFMAFVRKFEWDTSGVYKPLAFGESRVKQLNALRRVRPYVRSATQVYALEAPVHIASCSKELCSLLDYTESRYGEIIRNNATGNVMPEDVPRFKEFLKRAAETHEKETCYYRMEKRDGSILYVFDVIEVQTDSHGLRYGLSTLTDITECILNEEAQKKELQKSQNYSESLLKIRDRYERFVLFSGLCFFEYDIDTGHYSFGKNMERVLLYTQESFRAMIDEQRFDTFSGKIYGDIIYLVHRDDREKAKKILGKLNEQLVSRMEVRMLCGDRRYHEVILEVHMLKEERCTIGCLQSKDNTLEKLRGAGQGRAMETRILNNISAFGRIKSYLARKTRETDALVLMQVDRGDKEEGRSRELENLLGEIFSGSIVSMLGGNEYFAFMGNIENRRDPKNRVNQLKESCQNFQIRAEIVYSDLLACKNISGEDTLEAMFEEAELRLKTEEN